MSALMTPGKTIRRYCVHCNGEKEKEVRTCDADGKDPNFRKCPFHPYRMRKGRPSVKVIRRFCLQCMGGRSDFVMDCDTVDCFCFPYRLGKNPNMAHIGFASKN